MSRRPSRFAQSVESLESRQLLAATPVLVGDIDKTTDMLAPGVAVQAGQYAYFAGRPNAGDGAELFRTDGTKAGTTLVKAINPSGGSNPTNLTNVNGTLYFAATDAAHGTELWKSDGTASGTVRVTDLAAGTASASPANLTAVGSTLYFTAATDSSGLSTLWRTDGTAAGTKRVTFGGTNVSPYSPGDLTNVNGQLFFQARPDTAYATPSRLYHLVNGVAVGFSDIPVGVSAIVSFGGYAYFTADPTDNGVASGDLWRTDGTAAGTKLIKSIDDFNDNYDYAQTQALTVSGDRLYFEVVNTSDYSATLWRTDGTTAGTLQVGAGNFRPYFFAVGTRSILYLGSDANTGQELYVSDGTAAGTKLLKDLAPGTASGTSEFGGAARLAGGKLLFVTSTGYGVPTQIWTTDGTAANTKLGTTLGDIPVASALLGTVNGIALIGSNTSSNEQGDLYRSDGTAGGTSRIGATVAANGSGLGRLLSDDGPEFFAVGNTVYFTADDGKTGYELYKTVSGGAPTLVADLAPGGVGSHPTNFTLGGDGSLYFQAESKPVTGNDIYRIPEGGGAPQLVVAAKSLAGTTGFYDQFQAVGGVLYFTAVVTGAHYTEQLYRYDPATKKTTVVLTDSTAELSFTPFAAAGSTWYFGVRRADFSGNVDTETQWLCSITNSATSPVRLLAQLSSTAYTGNLTVIGVAGSTVYFTPDPDDTHMELWKSDGTTAGTARVTTLNGSFYGTLPGRTLAVGGVLYFSAYSGTFAKPEAFRTDGTAAGTVALGGVDGGADFVTAGGKVYFVGSTTTSAGSGGVVTSAVYRVDGTQATRVQPTATGDAAFTPTGLTVAGGKIFAVGVGGDEARYELWQADAALVSFTKVTTLAPYASQYAAGGLANFTLPDQILTATATDLYFPMYTAATGVEPYRLSLAAAAGTASISGTAFNDNNKNAKYDTGDSAAKAITVFLDTDNDGVLDANETSVLTDSSGKFTFGGLAAGTYHVRRVLAAGQSYSTTKPDVSLASGQAKTGLVLGVKKA